MPSGSMVIRRAVMLIVAIISLLGLAVLLASSFAYSANASENEAYVEGELVVVFDGYAPPEAKQAVLDDLHYESVEEIETVWNSEKSLFEEVCLVRLPSISCEEAVTTAVSHGCVIERTVIRFMDMRLRGITLAG